jgi:hypothetical protein
MNSPSFYDARPDHTKLTTVLGVVNFVQND